MSDFSQAVRGLRRSPALVAVAVLSLTLGIGANVTVFSVVREMILDDLSARRPINIRKIIRPRSTKLSSISRSTGPIDRKSTRLDSSHVLRSRMPSSA